MAFRINHIHLKASDPRKTAEWYVRAFNFKIMSDETRVFGDRFVRCQSEDGGMAVNISGARTGERLGPGDASAHHGLEHFGFDSTHLETDITRLEVRRVEAEVLEPVVGARVARAQALAGARAGDVHGHPAVLALAADEAIAEHARLVAHDLEVEGSHVPLGRLPRIGRLQVDVVDAERHGASSRR